MVRHSREDAVDEATFARLLDACDDLEPRYQDETRFVLIATGRLGLRAGELAHLSEEWIDWDRSQIQIPAHDPCTKGRDGGVCGYCKKRARHSLEFHPDKTLEEAVAERWNPKTSNSVRPIPFDFSEEIAQAVEDFFWCYDRYEHSRVSVNRRVWRVAEAAGVSQDRLYPHALRATAASWHAYRGLSAPALQALLGWAKLGTAQKYIRLSGEATAKALREAHSD